MLAGGTHGFYRRALAAPNTEYVKVEVTDGDGNVLAIPRGSVSPTGGLKILDGGVTATLASSVTRQASITVDASLYPETINGILAPYGNRLNIYRGIAFAGGSSPYIWQVFTGRIQEATEAPDGTVLVPASDRANEIIEAGFITPQNSQVGNLVTSEFVRLVSDALSDAVFGSSDSFGQTVPLLTWEYDRAGALEEMATTVGAFWYVLANGSFVLRKYPWTVPGSPVVTLSDGAGGVVVGTPTRSRDGVWNSITVSGERADGSAPVIAFAEDNNPASPTYVRGSFGRRHRSITLRTPSTQGQAQTAANDWLRRSIGLFETWSWTQPPDASLELGDVIGLNAYGRSGIIQVVSGFTLPLTPGGMMTVQAHAQVIGALE